jgi:uncharacterized protein YdiU (UPF0061 family)
LEFVSVGQCSLSSDSGSSSIRESILERYQTQYQQAYLEMMRNKLGLFFKRKDEPAYSYADRKSTTAETDMTIFFRKLSEIKKQQTIEDAFLLKRILL